jgi:hypothetical protein
MMLWGTFKHQQQQHRGRVQGGGSHAATARFATVPFVPMTITALLPFVYLSVNTALFALLQAAVDEARVQLAAGQSVPGILGSLVSAVDEQGNRWGGAAA